MANDCHKRCQTGEAIGPHVNGGGVDGGLNDTGGSARDES